MPLAAYGQQYGMFTERIRVSKIAPGYKSAHLLWPHGNSDAWELDYPEGDWDQTFWAYAHVPNQNQESFEGTTWSDWHEVAIEWTPESVKFWLDHKVVGTSSQAPQGPMEWVIQNESSLDGETAAPNSYAQMDISYVAVYTYE